MRRFSAAAISTGLALAACGGNESAYLENQEILSHGQAGDNITFEADFGPEVESAITQGIDQLRAIGGCTINVTVHDLSENLEVAGNDPSFVGAVGVEGGDIYIHPEILENPAVDVSTLAAHEGAHACVTTTRKVEEYTVEEYQFKGTGVEGFTLAGEYLDEQVEANNIIALDEAAAEYISQQATGEQLPDLGYGGIRLAFARIVEEMDIPLEDIIDAHSNSDVERLTELMTGSEDVDIDTIMCVAGTMGKVQFGYIPYTAAIEEIPNC